MLCPLTKGVMRRKARRLLISGDNTMNNNSIVVEAQMLILRPISEVFEAFVNPEITTKFWFTRSSGRLELGKKVRWDWEMFGVGDGSHG